ncbi:short-chain dehydrogenase/reductase [Dothidotthia symphoricarpi CBS 119687]|uniref:Short-chain dehydrogenase/reductase n=1 Tax=Dothidotthia symphoricarpi CBS 119687 TaxID=1392245 RepID=A0A6A6A5A7_9PLEO|nr:short-chain dehydrogenase/reductase [Dothidotthia symphoricarpi CBS 119687]KAF2126304.1 short-chain dehydrogenase/reductase [Dothidotthia symphoricarpi CBS 119687]
MASTTKTFHHAPYPAISAENPSNSQAGKTVLITGSASGVGYETANKFAQANASRIIISGRNSETLNKAATDLKKKSKSSEILTRVSNINEETSIDQLWTSFSDEGIVIDVLILNAADTSGGPANPLLNVWPQFRAMFNTNVFGNVLMAARFLDSPNLVKQGKTLINLTSCLAHSNPARLQAAYSASKVASSSFFQHLAQEIPVDQCRIINLHPGLIPNTSSTDKAPPELIEMVRWDEVDLPASVCVWASTTAASFLHGRFIWSNWDVEELAKRKIEFQEPGYLRIGLQGVEYVDVTKLFDQIREKDASEIQ